MMTDKQMQMMDHLSEPGHATIKHHLVTDASQRAIASQPSDNKNQFLLPTQMVSFLFMTLFT